MAASVTAQDQRVWTVMDVIRASGEYLDDKGLEHGRLDAEHLLAHVLGMGRLHLYLHFDRPLTVAERGRLKPLLRRRAAREPLQYEYGDFFNGTRQRVSIESVWRYNTRLALESTYEFNHINLPNGTFNTHLFGHRFLYSFSPDMFVRGFLQWNSAQELVGGNFLFNYRYLPGSDLFLVYNQVWDTEGGLQQASRSLQLKVSYYWQR